MAAAVCQVGGAARCPSGGVRSGGAARTPRWGVARIESRFADDHHGPMIRVAVVDDHPAIRAGLALVIDSEIDMAHVGAAARAEEVEPLVYRTRPDVVIL